MSDSRLSSEEELYGEIDFLRSELATLEDKYRTAVWSRDHERSDNGNLRSELAAKDARIAAVESQLGSARKQLETIWAVVSGLNPAREA